MVGSPPKRRQIKAKERKFYVVGIGGFRTAPACEIENLAALTGGRQVLIPPRERGFVPFPEGCVQGCGHQGHWIHRRDEVLTSCASVADLEVIRREVLLECLLVDTSGKTPAEWHH